MSEVYQSMKLKVQQALHGVKNYSKPVAAANAGADEVLKDAPATPTSTDGDLTLNAAIENLESVFREKLGRLRSAVQEREAVIEAEAQQARQLVESLKVSIGTLESKLRESDQSILSREKTEQTLNAKIQNLQIDANKKADELARQAKEADDLKSKINRQVELIAALESAIEKANMEAARHFKRAEDLTQSSHVKITSLESELRDAHELARQKEAMIKRLEHNRVTEIQNVEIQLKDKDALLAGRAAEINDLKSHLKLLTDGIRDVSSFFKRAEALAATAIERQAANQSVLNDPVNRGEEKKPAAVESTTPETKPAVSAVASPEPVR